MKTWIPLTHSKSIFTKKEKKEEDQAVVKSRQHEIKRQSI